MSSDPLFAFPQMKLLMNASYGFPAKPCLVPRFLPGYCTVLLRRHVRNKGDPLCGSVGLVERNYMYSVIRFRDGQETTVSTSYLAPFPRYPVNTEKIAPDAASNHPPPSSAENFSPARHDTFSTAAETFSRSPDLHSPSPNTDSSPLPAHENVQHLRRSTRWRKHTDRFGDWST